jgi:hypothetical protein
LEFGCNFIGVIPVVEQNRRSLAIASRSLSHPIRIKNNLFPQPQASRGHETGEREIRFSLPQIKRLIELMQRAGMSSDDLPDDIE